MKYFIIKCCYSHTDQPIVIVWARNKAEAENKIKGNPNHYQHMGVTWGIVT